MFNLIPYFYISWRFSVAVDKYAPNFLICDCVFFSLKDPGKKVNCRIDWHQTAQFVTISAFAKVAIPEKTVIKSNQVVCDIYIVFEGGKSSFEKKIVLKGVSIFRHKATMDNY